MAIKITGKSVFMDFEHVAETDNAAEKFIKGMLKINRELTLIENPKPERVRKTGRDKYRVYHLRDRKTVSDTWRERNKQYRLTIKIERI